MFKKYVHTYYIIKLFRHTNTPTKLLKLYLLKNMYLIIFYHNYILNTNIYTSN